MSKCSMAGCENEKGKSKKFCLHHFAMYEKGLLDVNYDKCSVEGCGRPSRTKLGICVMHYKRQVRLGSTADPYRTERSKRIKHSAFSDRISFHSCYFAGVLYGDGSVRYLRNSPRTTLSMTDFDVVESFASFVNLRSNEFDLSNDKRGNRKVSKRVVVTSQTMLDDLAYFQVIPNKTYANTYKYPQYINDRAYILGLYDSDGNIDMIKRMTFVGTAEFATELSFRLNELGFASNVLKHHGRNKHTIYIVSVSSANGNLERFVEWLYNVNNTPVYCKRKAQRVLLTILRRNRGICSENWVNCWKAKLGIEHANQQPSCGNDSPVPQKVQRLGIEESTNNMPVDGCKPLLVEMPNNQ